MHIKLLYIFCPFFIVFFSEHLSRTKVNLVLVKQMSRRMKKEVCIFFILLKIHGHCFCLLFCNISAFLPHNPNWKCKRFCISSALFDLTISRISKSSNIKIYAFLVIILIHPHSTMLIVWRERVTLRNTKKTILHYIKEKLQYIF